MKPQSGAAMVANLLRDAWANLDQTDLRLLLQERFGRPGQTDRERDERDVLHLPLARDKCRVALVYEGTKIVAIEPGAAFDPAEWDRICAEIDGPILQGTRKIGREFSFSNLRVEGWWRGAQSGLQILPPPAGAPRAAEEAADHPFILEFPLQDAAIGPITSYRRLSHHQKLTRLLNVLLAGTTKVQPDRRRFFWAIVQSGSESKWLWEGYSANVGDPVIEELSSQMGEKLEEIESERYYKEVGPDGLGLRVPDDLDDMICRYQGLAPASQTKFDRATYWLSMASRQWEDSMSASYGSLVSAAEALTTEESSKHWVYCDECEAKRPHDVPGATEKFRALFERYAPGPDLEGRRSKMYGLRSTILHGSGLMQLDEGRAFGWDPPWWNERNLHLELWTLIKIVARNWLREPPG
jgi:hypothetical protein